MKPTTVIKAAETISKNPEAGVVLGYILSGIGAGCLITGIGVLNTSKALIGK